MLSSIVYINGMPRQQSERKMNTCYQCCQQASGSNICKADNHATILFSFVQSLIHFNRVLPQHEIDQIEKNKLLPKCTVAEQDHLVVSSLCSLAFLPLKLSPSLPQTLVLCISNTLHVLQILHGPGEI